MIDFFCYLCASLRRKNGCPKPTESLLMLPPPFSSELKDTGHRMEFTGSNCPVLLRVTSWPGDTFNNYYVRSNDGTRMHRVFLCDQE